MQAKNQLYNFNIDDYVPDEDRQGNQIINGFTLSKSLGAGSYGRVFLAIPDQSFNNQQICAVKLLRRKLKRFKTAGKRRDSQDIALMDDTIKNQIQIMNKLHHPNIVSLKNVVCSEHIEQLAIFLQFCENGQMIDWNEENSSFQFVEKLRSDPLSQNELKKLISDLTNALRYIFQKNIVHRDIKPQNILFDWQYNAKLCDFGSAKQTLDHIVCDARGTPYFFAPECIQNSKHERDGRKQDIWALGVTIYCFMYLAHPFIEKKSENPLEKINEKILNGNYTFPVECCYDPKLKNLVSRMLEVDPHNRITLEQILENEWLNSDEEIASPTSKKHEIFFSFGQKIMILKNGQQNKFEIDSCEYSERK